MQYIINYIINVLVSIDQLANTILGGDPDMTISGRMGRAIKENRCVLCKVICRLLDIVDKGHCLNQDKNEKDEGADEIVKL